MADPFAVILYDVVSDLERSAIAEACKDYGLERIQYSAFGGVLSRNRAEELFMRACRHLSQGEGRINLFYMCERDFAMRREFLGTGLRAGPGPGGAS